MFVRGRTLVSCAFAASFWALPAMTEAQSCPMFVPLGPDDPTMAGSVTQLDPYCEVVTDGTYLKRLSTARLDSRATANGQCLNQTYDCIFLMLQERDVNHNDTAADIIPDGYKPLIRAYYSPINPLSSPSHVLDSRSGLTTPAPTTLLFWVGTWTFYFQSVQNRTNCQIEPLFGPLFKRTVHVLECLPTFWGSDPIERVRRGAAAVYIPPPLQGTTVDLAAGRAVTAWNTKLATYGQPVSFSLTYFPCSGPGCVKIDTGPPPISQPTNCSEPEPPGVYGADGSWAAPVTIRIRDAWSQWSQSFLDWLLAHELTHTLGLYDNTSCTLSQTLVGPFNSCGQNMANTAPTVNDALPVAKTTYTTGVSAPVCR